MMEFLRRAPVHKTVFGGPFETPLGNQVKVDFANKVAIVDGANAGRGRARWLDNDSDGRLLVVGYMESRLFNTSR